MAPADNAFAQNPLQGFHNPQPVNNVPAGTVFPGMVQPETGVKQPEADNHKPILGFLYSVSRIANGEFWPLYLGQNTIGRAMGSNVSLAEQTVSDVHCKVIVQELKNPDRLFVYVQESGSTCGTMVNGSSLDFNPREIKNGDIITVGENYELYVILIDVKQLGLAKKENFMAIQIQEPNPVPQGGGFIPPMFGGGMPGTNPTMPMGGTPNNPFPQPSPAEQRNRPTPGTVVDGNW